MISITSISLLVATLLTTALASPAPIASPLEARRLPERTPNPDVDVYSTALCGLAETVVPCRECPCNDCPIVKTYSNNPQLTMGCWVGGSMFKESRYWDRVIEDNCWINEKYITEGCWSGFAHCQ